LLDQLGLTGLCGRALCSVPWPAHRDL